MALAVIILACVALVELKVIKRFKSLYVEAKQYNTSLAEKLMEKKIELDAINDRIVRISAPKPEKQTAQYAAMKLSGKLGKFIKYTDTECEIVVFEEING